MSRCFYSASTPDRHDIEDTGWLWAVLLSGWHITAPVPQEIEPFELYSSAHQALHWILSSNGQQHEQSDTPVKFDA